MSPLTGDACEAAPGAGTSLPREKLVRGIRYFSILTVISLTILFYATSTRETLTAFGHLDLGFLLLAALLQVLDIFLGAWRNHVLVRKFTPGVSLHLCFRAQLANEFGAAVTPGQSGGGPAWLYVLHRGGIPIAYAMAVSIVVFLTTISFFLISTSVALYYLSSAFNSHALFYLLQIGFLMCTGMMVLIFLSLAMPGLVSAWLQGIASQESKSPLRWRRSLSRCCAAAEKALQQYHHTCRHFFRKDLRYLIFAFVITSAYYLVKLNLAYVILLGLGLEVDYINALALLAILRFILYFTPTPGGSGIGELSIATLMASIVPGYLLPVYTVLYRAYHLFLPAIFGAWVLLKELHPRHERTTVINT